MYLITVYQSKSHYKMHDIHHNTNHLLNCKYGNVTNYGLFTCSHGYRVDKSLSDDYIL